ncbi:MAG: Hsp20/alpha crystallin family protein [Candidatus Hadarchaeota archaeon]
MAEERREDDIVEVQPEEGKITSRRPYDLWSEMDRMFEEFRSSFDDLFWPFRGRRGKIAPIAPTTDSRPATDIADLGDKYEMRIELPGVSKDEVDIEVKPNHIEISAKHDETKEEKDKNWLRRERGSFSFYRGFEFPEEVKTDGVDAQLKDGVLTVTLPKIEPKPEQKGIKVDIK